MEPTDFPMMRAAARATPYFDSSVRLIAKGVAEGMIRNADYKEAKDTLSRAVEQAWRAQTSGFFARGEYEKRPQASELYWDVSMLGLYMVSSTSKKLAAYKGPADPAIDAMRAVLSEAQPLADAVASLKDKVVKGRTPRAQPVPVNPDKVIGTCGVCFRHIAVTERGVMALHGYRRPGHGTQTASCQGTRFRPLEVSDEGLRWLIGAYEKERIHALDQLARLDKGWRPDRLLVKRERGLGVEWIEPTDARWDREIRLMRAEAESTASSADRVLPGLRKKLAEWKKVGLPERAG